MSERTDYAHGTFCWVDLASHGMDAAKEFYGALFGWKAASQNTQGRPPYAMFQLNGKSVAGLGECSDEMKSQGIPPTWNSYISVDDIQAVTSKVTDLGGHVFMPVMQVLDVGWMAGISGLSGAPVMLWQKNTHFGAEQVNDVGTFCWNELATGDMEASQEFFGNLLNWQFEVNPNSPSPYVIIKVGDKMNGGIIQMNEQWANIPPHWMVYFTVQDADVASGRVKQLGGNVMMEPFDVDVGRIAVVSDAQGAVFSVIQINEAPD